MGVEARIVLHADDSDLARAAAGAAFARMDALDEALSDWKVDSELVRLCERAGDGAVRVSPVLFDALRRSIELAELTDGAFDPTVGPLVALWRKARGGAAWPSEPEIAAARALVGVGGLSLDSEGLRVDLGRRGVRLDFGGIGKGLACDRALAALYEHGIRSASVELGGELALGDPPPGQAGWPVAMECGGGRPGGWLELSNVGVATSGSGEQFVEHEGEHFSHVIDPRSGLGVQHEVCATVVASDAATADALASAVLVAGPRKARTIVRRVQGATLRLHPPDARALFDGETLTGWTESGGRYDGDADWTVEDGAIVGRVGEGGRGGLLYTEDLFTSFELELDVRVDYPFDSGIFLRMAPEGKGAQITIDHREGGEIAAVYSDGFLKHDRETRLKEGEWNHFEVRCTGFDMRIEVWLNGDKVTDYSIEPDSPGYAPTGRIGLQVHGDRDDPRENAVRFRNVRVRELGIFGEELWQEPSQERLALTGAATEAGWRSLLARDSLEGWGVVGPEEGYRVENAELFVPKAGGSGHVWTSEDFEDFRLRLDFMTSEVANSGVFLRADRGGGNPAYSGCEVQILDDFNWEKAYESTLLPTQFTGSLYGAVPPGRRDALREPGNWNTYEILYRGPRLAVALNGIPLYDVRTHELEADPPFAERVPRGAIGLQRYDCPQATGDWTVRFRNVFVQALK